MLDHLVDCAVVEVIINPRVSVPPHRGQKREEEEEEMMSHSDALSLTVSHCPNPLAFLLAVIARGACRGEMGGCSKCRLLYRATPSQPSPPRIKVTKTQHRQKITKKRKKGKEMRRSMSVGDHSAQSLVYPGLIASPCQPANI